MTTPRPHAERESMADAVRDFLSTITGDGHIVRPVSYMAAIDKLRESLRATEPIKRTLTVTVNGVTKEWVLPEPLKDVNPIGTEYWFRDSEGVIKSARVKHTSFIERNERGEAYATEADAKAWAEFDAWCRGGGA